MSTKNFDCYESSDIEDYSNNSNNSESPKKPSDLHQSTNIQDRKNENIIKIIPISHDENCQIETEIANIEVDDYMVMKDIEHITLNHVELLPDHLNEIVINEIQKSENTPIIFNQRNDNNFPNSKRNLIKMITMENNSSNPVVMSERMTSLNKCYSVDNDEVHSNLQSFNEDSIDKTETRKLFLDPDFKRKMKELYHPNLNSEIYSRSKSSSEMKKDEINNFNRSDSNCEIVEENFLPVSTTAKHLEHQLSFTSSPISPAMSPRIPKLTRFARLNRFLSVSPEPE